jgi:hypothetical protein
VENPKQRCLSSLARRTRIRTARRASRVDADAPTPAGTARKDPPALTFRHLQNQCWRKVFQFATASSGTYTVAMTAPRIRPPSGLKPPDSAPAGLEAQLLADRDTLREIVAGLDRLEQLVEQTPVQDAAMHRGYFTPDEDDRVRQALLAYRNYRLAAYEIIFRHRDYAQIADETLRLRCFLLAFAAALVLYAKSPKILEVAEHRPLLRAKINEPDAKFDLEAGFFDDVLIGYSSLSNYRALVRADRFWRSQRNVIARLGLVAEPAWMWLPELIRHKRQIVRQRLVHVLWQRLRYDWRAFWRNRAATRAADALRTANLAG